MLSIDCCLVVCCLLFDACCALPVGSCLLYVHDVFVCCVVFGASRWVCVVYVSFWVACCVWLAVCCLCSLRCVRCLLCVFPLCVVCCLAVATTPFVVLFFVVCIEYCLLRNVCSEM